MSKERPDTLELLRVTPSSGLGSCRHKLTAGDYEQLLDVFKAHNIRYFLYIGGNDSMDTAHQVGELARNAGYDLCCMGVPKTIDNDLDFTDHCPGFGSVARWLATSVRDAGLDTEAIGVVDKVKVIEIMGRNAGWVTAATALARDHADAAPHLLYLPERPIHMDGLVEDVQRTYERLGYVVICVCEGVRGPGGQPLSVSASVLDVDSFGHRMMGNVAELLCREISTRLKLKTRFDKPGTIQRVAGALASETDRGEAYMVGQMAVRYALGGTSDKMVTLVRECDDPYSCTTGLVGLEAVANAEKLVPDHFINKAGNDVTDAFLAYARPLMGGPLPEYGYLQRVMVRKRLNRSI